MNPEAEPEDVEHCSKKVPEGTPHARSGNLYTGDTNWVCSRPKGHSGMHQACEGHHYNNTDKLWYEWLELFVIEEEFLP